MQNSAGTVLQFELYPPLFTYNVGFYASRNVNIVERWVSVPAVQLLFGSALTISFGLACSRGGWSHFFRLRLRSCSKMFDSGSGLAILQIWESDSCSDSGYNHRSSRNLPMFLLTKWPCRVLLLPKLKIDSGSGSGFSQIFDSGFERKTQNSAVVDSGNPYPAPRLACRGYTFDRRAFNVIFQKV